MSANIKVCFQSAAPISMRVAAITTYLLALALCDSSYPQANISPPPNPRYRFESRTVCSSQWLIKLPIRPRVRGVKIRVRVVCWVREKLWETLHTWFRTRAATTVSSWGSANARRQGLTMPENTADVQSLRNKASVDSDQNNGLESDTANYGVVKVESTENESEKNARQNNGVVICVNSRD